MRVLTGPSLSVPNGASVSCRVDPIPLRRGLERSRSAGFVKTGGSHGSEDAQGPPRRHEPGPARRPAGPAKRPRRAGRISARFSNLDARQVAADRRDPDHTRGDCCDERTLLAGLALKHLGRHGGDPERSLAALYPGYFLRASHARSRPRRDRIIDGASRSLGVAR
jgi:hypothetical protein